MFFYFFLFYTLTTTISLVAFIYQLICSLIKMKGSLWGDPKTETNPAMCNTFRFVNLKNLTRFGNFFSFFGLRKNYMVKNFLLMKSNKNTQKSFDMPFEKGLNCIKFFVGPALLFISKLMFSWPYCL